MKLGGADEELALLRQQVARASSISERLENRLQVFERLVGSFPGQLARTGIQSSR